CLQPDPDIEYSNSSPVDVDDAEYAKPVNPTQTRPFDDFLNVEWIEKSFSSQHDGMNNSALVLNKDTLSGLPIAFACKSRNADVTIILPDEENNGILSLIEQLWAKGMRGMELAGMLKEWIAGSEIQPHLSPSLPDEQKALPEGAACSGGAQSNSGTMPPAQEAQGSNVTKSTESQETRAASADESMLQNPSGEDANQKITPVEPIFSIVWESNNGIGSSKPMEKINYSRHHAPCGKSKKAEVTLSSAVNLALFWAYSKTQEQGLDLGKQNIRQLLKSGGSEKKDYVACIFKSNNKKAPFPPASNQGNTNGFL
ncbi:MAG: hypothetical protein WC506_07090, partial [Candidatus Micrarchaeia archaeon]